MERERFERLFGAYLNTNYLTENDVIYFMYGDYMYEASESVLVEFRKILEDAREIRFEDLDNNDGDGDLDLHIKVLTRNIQAFTNKHF